VFFILVSRSRAKRDGERTDRTLSSSKHVNYWVSVSTVPTAEPMETETQWFYDE
jgi:hypothetical protein